jgi:hypothetical protein
MSTLYQALKLACPYNRARELLAETMAPLAGTGEPRTLTLRTPLVIDGADLSKDVVFTVGTAQDPMHFDQVWSVHWHPTEGGLYPSFSGSLAVRADETYRSSMLELQGAYEPPLGAVGKAFDATVGTRIASATARELLRSIGAGLEEKYFKTEQEKATRRNEAG